MFLTTAVPNPGTMIAADGPPPILVFQTTGCPHTTHLQKSRGCADVTCDRDLPGWP